MYNNENRVRIKDDFSFRAVELSVLTLELLEIRDYGNPSIRGSASYIPPSPKADVQQLA